jgi:hypothetical protein
MPLSTEDFGAVIADALHPRNFFLPGPASLTWAGPEEEEVPWEIFQGRLLDRVHTRQQVKFLSWDLFWNDETGRSEEPILAVKHDNAADLLHVVRSLHCYVWEGYDSGGGVFLSREITRWVRELVGTISLDTITSEQLRRDLAGLLDLAVVGTSRLPLTSLESPLPAFSLGQLGYFPQPGSEKIGPMQSAADLLRRALPTASSWSAKARVLEAALRSIVPADVSELAGHFADLWSYGQAETGHLLRALFNQVALSPWTGFVDNALAFLQYLVGRGFLGLAEEADFLTWLLRHLGRHLTAYDLVTFHHRGANYPDALLLDAVLKHGLALAEQAPCLFLDEASDAQSEQKIKRLRRRGLRQGWLLRRHYEGHPVPDSPTSPGENQRVLPAPHLRVPEEQILQSAKRRRRLFADDPLLLHLGERCQTVLQQSIRDLHHPEELRELGMGVFIDRPLGVFKSPAEPDQTILLSHEAFSRSIAKARLKLVGEGAERDRLDMALAELQVPGLPLSAVQCEEGRVVSLADVGRAASDFVLLRTTKQSVEDFLDWFDFANLDNRYLDFRIQLIVPIACPQGATQRVLAVYDVQWRKRLELGFRREQGYEVRSGREYPRGGLEVLRVWQS